MLVKGGPGSKNKAITQQDGAKSLMNHCDIWRQAPWLAASGTHLRQQDIIYSPAQLSSWP